MTWAIAKRPTVDVASMHDPRNPPPNNELMSQRILAAAEQEGTENEPTLVHLVKAFEKLEVGPMVDKSELVFIGYELEAAIQAFNESHTKLTLGTRRRH